MAFSEDTIKQAFARAGKCCQCTRKTCDHPTVTGGTRCTRTFTYGQQGTKWEAHHRVSVDAGGSDSLANCEILCGPRSQKGTCHYHVHS